VIRRDYTYGGDVGVHTVTVRGFGLANNDSAAVDVEVLDWPCELPNVTLRASFLQPKLSAAAVEHGDNFTVEADLEVECMKSEGWSGWTQAGCRRALVSGAGMDLKVRGRVGGGGTHPAQSLEKFSLVVPLHVFGSTSTISRFGERYRDGQYISVSFLFAVLLLTVHAPRAQPFVTVGSTCPVESAPLAVARNFIWGRGQYGGADKQVAGDHERGCGKFGECLLRNGALWYRSN